MRKPKEAVIQVLNSNTMKGGWFVRFIHQEAINSILESSYIEKSFPMQISCTTLMESVTVKNKYQQAVFTGVETCEGKLYFEKLHICITPEQAPIETCDISKNAFVYEGFWGIKAIKSLEISLVESFDMRELIRELKIVIAYLSKMFRFHTEINALDLLDYILDVLNISLQDIKFLDLSNLLEIRSGKVVYTKKITRFETVLYSNFEASYQNSNFSFAFDIDDAVNKILDNHNSIENSYTLTLFGMDNIQTASPKDLIKQAMIAIDIYAKEMNEFNLSHQEITVEPGD